MIKKSKINFDISSYPIRIAGIINFNQMDNKCRRGWCGEKRTPPYSLLIGLKTGPATMEISMKNSKIPKNKSII